MMKLLLDENISSRIIKYLISEFPSSSHIDYLKMRGCKDTDIWEYAKLYGYIIISKDNDFRQRSFLHGAPPKVIWLSVGNNGTHVIKNLILKNVNEIYDFYKNDEESLFVLELE